MLKTIYLPAGKQLNITSNEFTSGTYNYRTQPGEQPTTPVQFNVSTVTEVAPESFNRYFEIRSNSEVTTEITTSNLQSYTQLAVKDYTQDGEINTSYGFSILIGDSAYLNMTLPDPSDTTLDGRVINIMTGSLHTHDIRISGTGNKFHLGASTPFDALDFNNKYGANITLTVMDGRWIVLENTNVAPYND